MWHFQWLGRMNRSQEQRPLNAYKRMFGCLHAWLCLHNPGQAMACLWLGSLRCFPIFSATWHRSHKWQSSNATVEEILHLKLLKSCLYIVGINQLVCRISSINRVSESSILQVGRLPIWPADLNKQIYMYIYIYPSKDNNVSMFNGCWLTSCSKKPFQSNCVTPKYLMVYTLWN